ncbi:8-oxo-dGTP diphosphatase [Candidatus Microgenomates bacterium]|nr:8-oxo-dGTP diphosphatase [Candidatus Microgenomates bacterium]
MDKLRDATLLFLVKKSDGEIKNICLAMKKRGFGMNRWNGVGGKVNDQRETIEDAARRETKEEIDVDVQDLNKVAELSFYFPHNPAWDQMVHVYLVENWNGEPKESDEMKPKWFPINELPFQEMWPDDIFWLPDVIKGNLLKGMFKFGEKDIVLDKKIDIVDKL